MYTEAEVQAQDQLSGSTQRDVECLPSMCRGLYHRVAEKVGCDPSYVSRVARGERTSRAVSEALRAEVQLAWAKASEFANTAKQEQKANGAEHPSDGADGSAKILRRKTKVASA
jgi:hypothetical protein